ncbi:MAG: exodeoxyribonuclease III, partial [Methanobacteriaceae archaeon]|nr:exodeoxyribonuclease III [Methanobacteriaceae archaeon]
AGFLPEERKMIDCFLKSGFKDAFRELYPEEEKFSWMSWRTRNNPNLGGGLRLDYFFVNDGLMDSVVDCEIKDFNLSDHCQLFLKLNLKKENVED